LATTKKDIRQLSLADLEFFFKEIKQPSFRA